MPVCATAKDMLGPPAPSRVRISSAGGSPDGSRGRRCCGTWWRDPQSWLMMAMCILALFIFAVRIYQSQQVRSRSALPTDRVPMHEWRQTSTHACLASQRPACPAQILPAAQQRASRRLRPGSAQVCCMD